MGIKVYCAPSKVIPLASWETTRTFNDNPLIDHEFDIYNPCETTVQIDEGNRRLLVIAALVVIFFLVGILFAVAVLFILSNQMAEESVVSASNRNANFMPTGN